MVFLFLFVNVMICVYRFINIRQSLVSGINPPWSGCIFYSLLDLVCW